MADEKPDPHYTAHYVHHRTSPPVWVTSEAMKDRLIGNTRLGLRGEGYTLHYQHQSWPKLLYHKSYDPALETAIPDLELITPNHDHVAQAKLRTAILARDRQRVLKIKKVENEAAAKALGKDWTEVDQCPLEKARVAKEAQPYVEDALA